MEACNRAPANATMKALAQAVPQKRWWRAASIRLRRWCSRSCRIRDGRCASKFAGGGWGAAADKDGCDGVDTPLSNCSDTPVEALDQDFGFFRVVEYALRQDSCGVGEMRGGLGFVRSDEILEDGVHKSALYSASVPGALDGSVSAAVGERPDFALRIQQPARRRDHSSFVERHLCSEKGRRAQR